jgi:hypothetical protein
MAATQKNQINNGKQLEFPILSNLIVFPFILKNFPAFPFRPFPSDYFFSVSLARKFCGNSDIKFVEVKITRF